MDTYLVEFRHADGYFHVVCVYDLEDVVPGLKLSPTLIVRMLIVPLMSAYTLVNSS